MKHTEYVRLIQKSNSNVPESHCCTGWWLWNMLKPMTVEDRLVDAKFCGASV